MKAATNVIDAIDNNRYFYTVDGDLFIGATHLYRAGCLGFYWLEQYIKNDSDCVHTSMVVDDFGNLRCR